MHKYMHIHACINIPTHAQTHNILIELSQYLQLYPYTIKYANLEPICGAPTEALAEASGAAEGVVG